MAALTQDTDYFVKQIHPGNNFVKLMIQCKATMTGAQTVTLTLKNYGINHLIGVLGFTHSTANSVMVAEQPTTAVTSGVLVITAGSTAGVVQPRYYEIYGTSTVNP